MRSSRRASPIAPSAPASWSCTEAPVPRMVLFPSSRWSTGRVPITGTEKLFDFRGVTDAPITVPADDGVSQTKSNADKCPECKGELDVRGNRGGGEDCLAQRKDPYGRRRRGSRSRDLGRTSRAGSCGVRNHCRSMASIWVARPLTQASATRCAVAGSGDCAVTRISAVSSGTFTPIVPSRASALCSDPTRR